MRALLSIFKLIRLPNIFTAISNVWAGTIIAAGGNFSLPNILFVSIGSAALYGGGVTLNDYCDHDYDKQYRPKRPIPSGRVTTRNAFIIGVALLGIGIVFGFLISLLAGVISSTIALFALLYDALLKGRPDNANSFKKWFLPGIITMGACRGFNWTLGLEAGGKISGMYVLIPVAVFVYTTLLTAISRFEVAKPTLKKLVVTGIILFPLIDGSIVIAYGYWWQGLIVGSLLIPTFIFSKIFEIS